MAAVSVDLANELQYFQSTKAGVKGLVDSGITNIPKMFIHPKEEESLAELAEPGPTLEVPVIDLSSNHTEIINQVYKAASTYGFFQLTNHGIPQSILDEMIEGVRAFHEGDSEIKSNLYTLERVKKVRYFSNSRMYKSAFGNWHDSLVCEFDESLDFNEIPLSCREAMVNYKEHLLSLSKTICEFLSQSLGLQKDYLININAAQKQSMIGHYYPPCPEPDLAMGTQKHRDPCFLTILLQDLIGGLQVSFKGRWIDVKPVRGALIVNIGDLLQLVSNDELKSVEHRVLANNTNGPRLSVATFLNPKREEEKPYGPIKELLSDENPPIYREVLFRDYILIRAKGNGISSTALDSTALDNFKL